MHSLIKRRQFLQNAATTLGVCGISFLPASAFGDKGIEQKENTIPYAKKKYNYPQFKAGDLGIIQSGTITQYKYKAPLRLRKQGLHTLFNSFLRLKCDNGEADYSTFQYRQKHPICSNLDFRTTRMYNFNLQLHNILKNIEDKDINRLHPIHHRDIKDLLKTDCNTQVFSNSQTSIININGIKFTLNLVYYNMTSRNLIKLNNFTVVNTGQWIQNPIDIPVTLVGSK